MSVDRKARALGAAFGTAMALLILCAIPGCTSSRQPASSDDTAGAAQSQYVAIARGRVDVQGGLARVVAQRDGVISEINAEQGDQVRAGQILAQLDVRAAQNELDSAKAQADEARAQFEQVQVKLREAQQRAPRIEEAARAGAATGDAADEADNEVASLQAQADAAKAALGAANARVGVAQLDVDARSLRAPVAGRVVQRDVQIGQAVSAQSGTALFTILPDRPRIVRAELDAADADKVKPGMRAQVVRDTGEGPAYSARVLRVGEILGPSILAEDPLARATSREVECVLQLEPADTPPLLRIGQRVLVRFPR